MSEDELYHRGKEKLPHGTSPLREEKISLNNFFLWWWTLKESLIVLPSTCNTHWFLQVICSVWTWTLLEGAWEGRKMRIGPCIGLRLRLSLLTCQGLATEGSKICTMFAWWYFKAHLCIFSCFLFLFFLFYLRSFGKVSFLKFTWLQLYKGIE